jgi:polyisoprenoid-binding protein YceI
LREPLVPVVVVASSVSPPDAGSRFRVEGELTIRDTTRPVVLDVARQSQGTTLS